MGLYNMILRDVPTLHRGKGDTCTGPTVKSQVVWHGEMLDLLLKRTSATCLLIV
jgi:hypothetical protein